MHFWVCQLRYDLTILLLIQNVNTNKTTHSNLPWQSQKCMADSVYIPPTFPNSQFNISAKFLSAAFNFFWRNWTNSRFTLSRTVKRRAMTSARKTLSSRWSLKVDVKQKPFRSSDHWHSFSSQYLPTSSHWTSSSIDRTSSSWLHPSGPAQWSLFQN